MSNEEAEAFEGFEFQMGQRVTFAAAAGRQPVLLVIGRLLCESPAGVCRRYVVSGTFEVGEDGSGATIDTTAFEMELAAL